MCGIGKGLEQVKPLRQELESEDPTLTHAVRLLGAVGPLPESQLRMRRIRQSLDRRPLHRSSRLLRPVVALGVLFGGVATAWATWGVVHMVAPPSAREPVQAVETVEAKPRRQPLTRKVAPRNDVATNEAEAAVEVGVRPSAEPAELSETPGQPFKRSALAPKKRVRSTEADAGGEAVAKVSDSILVHDAIQELRNGGDAGRAARLLERYRNDNPDGVLAEEALALSIEAAVARKDPDARRLARHYLAKYPKGRFTKAARQAAR